MRDLRKPEHVRQGLGGILTALSLAFALAACGGGGGGGGDDDPSSTTNYTGSDETVTVDENNGSTAAGAGVDSFSASAGTTATGSDIAGGASLETAKQTKGLTATALEAYRKSQEHGLLTGRNHVAGVIESCPDGGTISVTWDPDGGQQEELDTAGDEVSLNFDSCQMGPTTYDGEFVLALKGIDTNTGNRDLRMAFDNLLVSQNDSPQIGANGALRFKSGTFADNFPSSGGHAGFSQAGNLTDQQFTVGSDVPLEIVDHTSDWVSQTTDLNYYLGDGNEDGSVDYTQDWYLVIHGDPAEICTTSLDGCINVNHDDTTGFTFYKEDYSNYGYPTLGVFRVDGDSGSYAKVDADTGDIYTVYLTVYDGTQFVIGPDSEEQWSLLSNRDFSGSL